MYVNKRTKTVDVMSFVTKENINDFLKLVPSVELDQPILDMTCGQFIEVTQENYAEKFFKEKYAFNAFGKLKQFRDEMKIIEDFLKRMELPKTTEETMAANGIQFPSFSERMLIDVQQFLHLHRIEDAKDVPFAEYLMMVKDKATSAKYERNLNAIYNNKNKAK